MERKRTAEMTVDVEHAWQEIVMGIRVDEMLAPVLTDAQKTPESVATGTITAGELSDTECAQLQEVAKRHQVMVDPDAPSCCIDGRTCVHTLTGEATTPRASVAGGALVTAYAAAELIGWFGDDAVDTQTRLARVSTKLSAGGINPGNHCDENAVDNAFKNPATGAPATGCGADDRLPEIIAKPYNHPEAVQAVTQTLLGEAYDESFLSFVPQTDIANQTANWNPASVINTIADGHNIEVLQSPHDKPNHGHAEVAVLFNYAEDTTLDRDAFVAETGRQVFVVDMWYIEKMARAMVGDASDSKQYQQFKHAMVAYQVATYLTLCDGSQRVMVAK